MIDKHFDESGPQILRSLGGAGESSHPGKDTGVQLPSPPHTIFLYGIPLDMYDDLRVGGEEDDT